MSFFSKASDLFKRVLTDISPELNIRVVYRMKKKKRLNLTNPQTFAEKLVYLRVTDYNHNPLVRELSDKYAVRDYVKQKGYSQTLNELYAVYDDPKQIVYEELPRQFALKLNVGCGSNYICSDKSKTDAAQIGKITRRWMKKKPWRLYAEMQYKGVDKKILSEKYLGSLDEPVPPDYKIYCFHGKPMAVLYIGGRFSGRTKAGFFDREWNYLGIKDNEKKHYINFETNDLPPKPKSLDLMFTVAEKLSDGFPFVRVDFFETNGNAIFGEMTFSPAGGYDAAEVDINGKSMAEYLNV